mmetsp:Transcript_23008/g.29390  ORF Transcript_23008/g.29390 Transcript_23008/m.29390 type:complete len:182 (-) Transcript_23008:248-793(-)
MFFNDQPVASATLASSLLWAYEMTRNILSGDALRGGYSSTAGLKLCVAVFLATAYATGINQDYADIVIKTTSAFWFLVGLQCVLAPESAQKVWQFGQRDERTQDNARVFGAFLMSHGLLTGTVSFFPETVTKTKAAGYSTLPWLLVMGKHLLDGTYAKYRVDLVPIACWCLWNIVAIVALF